MINLVKQREREVRTVRLKLEHQTVRAVHSVVGVGVHIANDRPVQDPVLDRRTLRCREIYVARRLQPPCRQSSPADPDAVRFSENVAGSSAPTATVGVSDAAVICAVKVLPPSLLPVEPKM